MALQPMQDDAVFGITYVPKDGPNAGKRHTAWLRWATAGEAPKDFGEVIKVFRAG